MLLPAFGPGILSLIGLAVASVERPARSRRGVLLRPFRPDVLPLIDAAAMLIRGTARSGSGVFSRLRGARCSLPIEPLIARIRGPAWSRTCIIRRALGPRILSPVDPSAALLKRLSLVGRGVFAPTVGSRIFLPAFPPVSAIHRSACVRRRGVLPRFRRCPARIASSRSFLSLRTVGFCANRFCRSARLRPGHDRGLTLRLAGQFIDLTVESKRLQERRQLAASQVPAFAECQTGQVQRSDSNPPQSLDRNPDRLHHPADDVERALVDDHLEDQSLIALPQDAEFARDDRAALDRHPVAYPLENRVARPGQRQDVVFLVEAVSRVHDAVRDIAVVGEEEQPFGVAVEPADRKHALRDMDQVHHRSPVPLVLHRRDVAARFIQQQVAGALLAELPAVDTDHGAVRIGFESKLRDHDAVDGDPSGRDQFFRRPAGADSAGGEYSLQTFHR
jgi:hypothetical protein